MTLKQFLKPDWRKVVVFAILFFFIPLFRCKSFILCEEKIGGYCPPFIEVDVSIIKALTSSCEISNVSLQVWTIIPAYLIACFIVFLYEKKKESIFNFLKPAKWKIIVFLICLLTLLSFLPNFYSLIEWESMGLRFVRDIGENITIILFPIVVITTYFLTPITTFISKILVFLTGLEFFNVDYYPQAAQLSGSGVPFVFILLIIEWYILSCLIVWIYDKVKKKKR
jgi:hypothetical protein